MKNIFYLLLLSVIMSCSANETFKLTGSLSDYPNGEVIYLMDYSGEHILDSTVVTANTFEFNTQLDSTPIAVWLQPKKLEHNTDPYTKEYRYMWLENKPMTFTATENDFLHAEVTGSPLETIAHELFSKTDTVSYDEGIDIQKKFMEDNPGSLISVDLLSLYSTNWGKEETLRFFSTFTQENKTSIPGRKISRFLGHNQNSQDPTITELKYKGINTNKLQVGSKLSNAVFIDMHGNESNIYGKQGKRTVVMSSFIGCGGCEYAMKKMKENNYNVKEDVDFVYYSFKDESTAINTYLKKKGFKGLGFGKESNMNEQLRAHAFPTFYIIDENGIVTDIYEGYGEELEAQIIAVKS